MKSFEVLLLTSVVIASVTARFSITQAPAFITPAPILPLEWILPRALVRRDCPAGYVTHLDGCCIATVLKDCGNGVTVCTATCPASSTVAPVAGCASGYVTHDTGCCLAASLKDCGNGVTVCTAACPVSSTSVALVIPTISTTATKITTSAEATAIPASTTTTTIKPSTDAAQGTSKSSSTTALGVFLTATNPSVNDNVNTSAILVILQTGIPVSAQYNAAAACFLNNSYTSFYSTPSWYTALPASAQSYFSSINSGNTIACTTEKGSGSGSSKLSAGAKAGIAIGAIVAAAVIGLLIWLTGTKAGLIGALKPAAPAPTEWDGVSPAGQVSWNGLSGQSVGSGQGVAEMGTSSPSHGYIVPVVGAARHEQDGNQAEGYAANGEYGPPVHKAHGNPIHELANSRPPPPVQR